MQGEEGPRSAPFSASVISIWAPGCIFWHVVWAAKTICRACQRVVLRLAVDGRGGRVAIAGHATYKLFYGPAREVVVRADVAHRREFESLVFLVMLEDLCLAVS
jgi:hypothetical protein